MPKMQDIHRLLGDKQMIVYAIHVGKLPNPFSIQDELDAYVGEKGIVLHFTQAIVATKEPDLMIIASRFENAKIVKLETSDEDKKGVAAIACRDDIQALMSYITADRRRQKALYGFWIDALTIKDSRCPETLERGLEKLEKACVKWPNTMEHGKGNQYFIM